MLVIPVSQAAAGLFNDGWFQMDESHLFRPTGSFSQRDINEGRVWFVAEEGFRTDSDMSTNIEGPGEIAIGKHSIEFAVSDSASPPNVLSRQKFSVNVEEPSALVERALPSTSGSNELEFEVRWISYIEFISDIACFAFYTEWL